MNGPDIRWIQRFKYYSKALDTLTRTIEPASERELTEAEKLGTIKTFEFTYELAWNLLKDFFEEMGETGMQGSKDVFEIAFQRGLIHDDSFMEMIKSRNQAVHTYNQETADEIFKKIIEIYYDAFVQLREAMLREKQKRNL